MAQNWVLPLGTLSVHHRRTRGRKCRNEHTPETSLRRPISTVSARGAGVSDLLHPARLDGGRCRSLRVRHELAQRAMLCRHRVSPRNGLPSLPGPTTTLMRIHVSRGCALSRCAAHLNVVLSAASSLLLVALRLSHTVVALTTPSRSCSACGTSPAFTPNRLGGHNDQSGNCKQSHALGLFNKVNVQYTALLLDNTQRVRFDRCSYKNTVRRLPRCPPGSPLLRTCCSLLRFANSFFPRLRQTSVILTN